MGRAGFGVSCWLSPFEIFSMKSQFRCHGRDKLYVSKCLQLKILPGVMNVIAGKKKDDKLEKIIYI